MSEGIGKTYVKQPKKYDGDRGGKSRGGRAGDRGGLQRSNQDDNAEKN